MNKRSLFLSIVIFATTAKAQLKPLSKDQVITAYKEMYLKTRVDSIIWNGDVKTCSCGTLQEEIYKKAEKRLNFFRLVTGLKEVKLDPKLNKEAQEAALFCTANNEITHHPEKNKKCYSQAAYNGCSKSCLGGSDFKYFPNTSFVTGFIDDYGAENYFLGHRRWLLYTRLERFGYGATGKKEALLTTDGTTRDTTKTPAFIAYPWHGYVPVNLVFPKWSFSIPESKKVNFDLAVLTVTDAAGLPVKTKRLKEYKDFLDHTLAWTVEGLFTEEEEKYGLNNLEKKGYINKRFNVQIKNVKVDGKMRNYEYFVELIKVL